jgi:hypothetical protein
VFDPVNPVKNSASASLGPYYFIDVLDMVVDDAAASVAAQTPTRFKTYPPSTIAAHCDQP